MSTKSKSQQTTVSTTANAVDGIALSTGNVKAYKGSSVSVNLGLTGKDVAASADKIVQIIERLENREISGYQASEQTSYVPFSGGSSVIEVEKKDTGELPPQLNKGILLLGGVAAVVAILAYKG